MREESIDAVTDAPVDEVVGTRVDLDDSTLLPGLWDLHVHMSASGGPYGYFPARPFYEEKLKAALRNGVTAMLDLGTQEAFVFELRRRLLNSEMSGPRLYAAGGMVTAPGGHPCRDGSPPIACHLLDEVEDVRPTIDELLERDPDVVKVIIEGGTEDLPLNRLDAALLDDIVDAAGSVPVVAHVGSVADVRDALDGGITRFAHVPYADEFTEEDVDVLVERDAIFIPTLAVSRGLAELARRELRDPDKLSSDVHEGVLDAISSRQYLDPMQTAEYQAYATAMHETTLANFELLVDAGVQIAAGTDAGNPNTFHGLAIARELELYVEHGMSVEGTLAAATSAAAGFVGSEAGVIAPGAPADLVVVSGDLTTDVTALSNVERIFVDGAEFDRDDLRVTSEFALDAEPEGDGAFGDVCLDAGECGEELVCQDWEFVCSDACSPTGGQRCEEGTCFSSTWQDGGYCFLGDGCDPLAQDCENGAACYWIGNGESTCFLASTSKQGEPCGTSNSCAPGYQCSFTTGSCAKICDPAAPDCPERLSCADLSAIAGMSVGECR